MEKSEAFRTAVAKLQAFEKQLLSCSQALKDVDDSSTQAEELIEEHFNRCENVLAARKGVLLDAIKKKVAIQSM